MVSLGCVQTPVEKTAALRMFQLCQLTCTLPGAGRKTPAAIHCPQVYHEQSILRRQEAAGL